MLAPLTSRLSAGMPKRSKFCDVAFDGVIDTE